MILRRRAERTAGQIIGLGYFLLAVVGFSASWWIRFKSGIFEVLDFQPFINYRIPIVLTASFWGIVFVARRLHRPDLTVVWWREGTRIAASSVLAMILPMAIAFTYRGYFYSRLVMAFGIVLCALLCFLEKEVAKWMLRKLVLKRVGTARKLMIGCGDFAAAVVEQMKKNPLVAAGLEGMLSLPGERCTAELPYLGEITDLKRLLIEHGFDEVILAHPSPSEETILQIIYECRKEQVQFELVPPFWHLLRGRVQVEPIGDVRTIAFADLALKGWQRIAKRMMDLILSTMLLIMLSPVFVLIAIAIKLTSSGPVFFLQERIGRNGRKFKMIKFRSMYQDAEKRLQEFLDKSDAKGPIFKMKRDPRITSVGRFLRRFSLDELPQIINVFLGDMSLVGPRPPLEREVTQYERWQLRRIDVTPGMTGLWQVSGRSDLPFDKMVQLDIYYIEHWSIWLDLKLLILTIPAVISGRGAY